MIHELVIDGAPTGDTKDFAGTEPSDFSEHPTKSAWVWLPVVVENATPGANETLGPVVKSVEGGSVFWRRAARALTAQELDDRDRGRLRAAVADAILVEVRLAQWIVANTAMEASDFRPAVRQAFLDLRTIADRLDPP